MENDGVDAGFEQPQSPSEHQEPVQANANFEDVEIDGLRFPGKAYHDLFPHQQAGVKWLWALHRERVGGILADEMGLGKTVQVCSFLSALHHTGLYEPSIVVCPATLLSQWERELQTWAPRLTPFILHDSATIMKANKDPKSKSKLKRKSKTNSDSEDSFSFESDDFSSDSGEEYRKWKSQSQGKRRKQVREPVAPSGYPETTSRSTSKWKHLIDQMQRSKHSILLTTYEQLRICKKLLLCLPWGYAILDEGHKIRNPEIETTLVCKQLATVHRIIMTGSPIQNKLSELWSLFDFVFPGRLGTLAVFLAQFDVQISVGGYANATPLQVATAYKCSIILRDLILPYILQRMKSDVEAQLPDKTEQVLFCGLTPEQRSSYLSFINSADVDQIFDGQRNLLYGIDILRKICNHPDLLTKETFSNHPDYGNPVRSGKMIVVLQLLGLWRQQNHRVLIFAQTQQMLDILESSMSSLGYEYRRMDGRTPVNQRARLIDEFNDKKSNVFVFILTTRVGGLGTNLVGANRVIIFDPDWNPSTDMQARERAWRIGQTRNVTIYRLVTKCTIEEKIYQKQIYKQILTNRVLKNPLQRRLFKSKDMRDLFVPPDEETKSEKSETASLFGEDSAIVTVNFKNRNRNSNEEENGKLGAPTPTLAVKEFVRGRGVESRMEEDAEEAEIVEGKKDCIGEGDRIENKKIRSSPFDHQKSEGKNKKGCEDEMKSKKKRRLENDADVDENNDNTNNCDGDEGEKKVLESLFASNGIFSAINQNAIETLCEKEKVFVDFEASKAAQKALQALRDSVSNSQTNPGSDKVKTKFGNTINSKADRIGISSGAINSRIITSSDRDARLASFTRPGTVLGSMFGDSQHSGMGLSKVGGVSSSELITILKKQKMESENAWELTRVKNDSKRTESDHISTEESSTTVVSPTTVKPVNNCSKNGLNESEASQSSPLANVICEYLRSNGGRAKSSAVVREFAQSLTHAEMKAFASTLKKVARIESGGVNEERTWVLIDP